MIVPDAAIRPWSKGAWDSLPLSSISGFGRLSPTTPLSPLAGKHRRAKHGIIEYARISTSHQDAALDAQVRQPQALGCDKVSEQARSGAERTRLAAGVEYVREGDTFIVTKLERLARSVAHLEGGGYTWLRKGTG